MSWICAANRNVPIEKYYCELRCHPRHCPHLRENELLDCPVRWASREYMMILSERFIATCTRQGRQDLAKRIVAKVESVGLEKRMR